MGDQNKFFESIINMKVSKKHMLSTMQHKRFSVL